MFFLFHFSRFFSQSLSTSAVSWSKKTTRLLFFGSRLQDFLHPLEIDVAEIEADQLVSADSCLGKEHDYRAISRARLDFNDSGHVPNGDDLPGRTRLGAFVSPNVPLPDR